MFSILISEKGGETKRMEFDRPEITIGRVAGNDIVLPRNNISKRHSRIVFKDGKFIVVDLKSTNGTFVNGRKITGPLVVKGSDKVYEGEIRSRAAQLGIEQLDFRSRECRGWGRRGSSTTTATTARDQADAADLAACRADQHGYAKWGCDGRRGQGRRACRAKFWAAVSSATPAAAWPSVGEATCHRGRSGSSDCLERSATG